MDIKFIQHDKIDIWKQCLANEYQAYLDSDNGRGVFSVDGYEIAEKVGGAIELNMEGICLDVGCGMLSRPSYMKNNGSIQYVGIDPLFGDQKRSFPFVQAIGEYLPFADNLFDGVLFASSLEHVINPMKSLTEAYRVLKPERNLFIWFTERDDIYRTYPHDLMHQWGFNERVLLNLFDRNKFCFRVLPLSIKEKLLIGGKYA